MQNMMKRIAAVLFACLLLGAAARAQDAYIGCMKVVNCQEWVSLREQPDAASECLVEVPLGAIVENCSAETKAFVYAEYNGMSGYIMAQYLQSVPVEQTPLVDMRVVDTGAWVPMRLGPSEADTVIQWMAPDTRIAAGKESANGYAYIELGGLKGYVRLDALASVEVE